MERSPFISGERLSVNCDFMHGIAFYVAPTREKCAQLPVICAVFGLSQGKSALFGLMERLSPHITMA